MKIFTIKLSSEKNHYLKIKIQLDTHFVCMLSCVQVFVTPGTAAH